MTQPAIHATVMGMAVGYYLFKSNLNADHGTEIPSIASIVIINYLINNLIFITSANARANPPATAGTHLGPWFQTDPAGMNP